MLGVGNARPQFWLFEDDARFTARLCSLQMEAFGATAGSAIEALRGCLGAYLRVYGRDKLTDPNEVSVKISCNVVSKIGQSEKI